MADYVYRGPGPVVTPEGEIVHPNDVRGFAEDPGAPWQLPGEAAGMPAPGTAENVIRPNWAPAATGLSVNLPAAVAGAAAADPEGM